MAGVLFLDGPARFEIKRDIVYIYGTINGEEAVMCLRVSDLPASMASAQKAFDKWNRTGAEVVPFVGRGKD